MFARVWLGLLEFAWVCLSLLEYLPRRYQSMPEPAAKACQKYAKCRAKVGQSRPEGAKQAKVCQSMPYYAKVCQIC